jgi:hypothetical protein
VTFNDWDKFSGLVLPNNWYAYSFVQELSVASLSRFKIVEINYDNLIYFTFELS